MGNYSPGRQSFNAYHLCDTVPVLQENQSAKPEEHNKKFNYTFQPSLINTTLTEMAEKAKAKELQQSSQSQQTTTTEGKKKKKKKKEKKEKPKKQHYTVAVSTAKGAGYIINEAELRNGDKKDYYIHEIKVTYAQNPFPCELKLIFEIHTKEGTVEQVKMTINKNSSGDAAFIKRFNNFGMEKSISEVLGKHHMVRKIEEMLPVNIKSSQNGGSNSTVTTLGAPTILNQNGVVEHVTDERDVRYFNKHCGIGFRNSSYMPYNARAAKADMDMQYNRPSQQYDFNIYKVENSNENVCFHPEGLRKLVNTFKEDYLSKVHIVDIDKCRVILGIEPEDTKKIVEYMLAEYKKEEQEKMRSALDKFSEGSMELKDEDSENDDMEDHHASSSEKMSSGETKELKEGENSNGNNVRTTTDLPSNSSSIRDEKPVSTETVSISPKSVRPVMFIAEITYYTIPNNEDYFERDFPFPIPNKPSFALGKR